MELDYGIYHDGKYTQTILNNMGDSVFVKDIHSKIVMVNDAFCKLVDLSRENIIGKTLAEIVSPTEREGFLKIDQQVLSDGIECIREETMTLQGGEKRILSTRKSRFIDENGEKFLLCVVRDITESKKAEETLHQNEAELKKIGETKDKLLSIIAHDLRSPFNNITMLSDMASNAIASNNLSQSKECLELIDTTTQNAICLLDNLLSWAKSQSGQIDIISDQINLGQIVNETLELSKAIAKTKNISLNYIENKNIEVVSDPKVIKTIIRNLVSNAIKFTPSGGHINISTVSNKEQVEVTVADNGIGMSQEECQKLFNINSDHGRIGTAKEKGSGFGLILSKDLAEKIGGKIWANSIQGKGSQFKFTIPLRTEPEEALS
ncbi:PAS domain-containing sensor histidine kinase [Zobellia galactanivorans]|uniref:histidine kinase n=1 Tax=Zobellia galactanivorans (strain DSM 12802 / CCUG 47099 / CIP 106680 / NCIMB 13871 / Dsij) TaxID=63186 RepID=G0LAI1_ZOBGA|nr:PAS domain-containing sensor histidine kinase [Zobellia galactanivorans]MBU3028189.1 PAS domain-containing sensor histidine kinase [Zobellia galactanivorans]CAZ95331.1 Two-component system-Sensor histidine kinase [Zobellia galactanivorans]